MANGWYPVSMELMFRLANIKLNSESPALKMSENWIKVLLALLDMDFYVLL